MGKQYNKVKFCAILHVSSKKSLLFVQFCVARGFCQRVQNSRICQHCDVKTSAVTPTFYYCFIISLTRYISVPSFIYNLCYVLLLRNHLKYFFGMKCPVVWWILKIPFYRRANFTGDHTDRSHFWGPMHSKTEEFRHTNRRCIKGCIILYIVRIFSFSELVEPHINPFKVRSEL